METNDGWTDADHGLVRFKIAVLREAITALEANGPDKIVMMELEGVDPEFFTFRFALSGDALLRIDDVARASGYLTVVGGTGKSPSTRRNNN